MDSRQLKRSRAQIEAFGQVPATCPKVYEAMNQATEVIVKETNALRSALIRALMRAHRAEEQLKRLQERGRS